MEERVVKYRVTCLTPTLVGDGQRLAPIDYMVWKDHVNVLDQRRIFRLLSKGPRLDSYLNQLKRSEKLDFASWGGFAQNFAGRRIPFEDGNSTAFWEKAHAENLFIPTFATGPGGPLIPGSAIKGALRTGVVHAHWNDAVMKDLAAAADAGDSRALRRPARMAEDAALGSGGANVMKLIAASDSRPVAYTAFKVYLLRVSTVEARGGGKYELAWKASGRGAVKRAEDGTPWFAEMAAPGTVFEGDWSEREFFNQPEIARALRKRQGVDRAAIFAGVNQYAGVLLGAQKQYGEVTGLAQLKASAEDLEQRVAAAAASDRACVLPLGWGGGFLSKAAFLDTDADEYRQVLRQIPFYAKAVRSGLPFPKTRRIVFHGNQPATLPGWVLLEIS
jgi:CRISPR-associated protein Csm5